MTEILVVDDDKLLLNSMLAGIEKMSPAFSVLPAENGLQALEMLKKHAIRLMVTDLRMPEMDGFALLAKVREIYPDIPVIVTTGHAMADDQKIALEHGALEVLYKPIALKELGETVRRLLHKQTNGGTLTNVSPAMFLQLIDMERKTCTVRIQKRAGRQQGVFFVRKGKLLNARMNELQGKAAALEIFSWDHVALAIENDCPVQEQTITQTLSGLILEASRLKDERDEFNETVPDEVTEPTLKKRVIPADPAHMILAAHLKKQLGQLPELNGYLHGIDHDVHWNSLLSQVLQIGALFKAGALKAVGITTGNSEDYVVFPTDPPTVLKMDPNCPMEKIYPLVQ
jgi:CheY-like chemotaxis protein